MRYSPYFGTGQFKEGLYEGRGVLTSKTGAAHEGYFKGNVPCGSGPSPLLVYRINILHPRTAGKLTDPTGSVHEGFWYYFSKNDLLYGPPKPPRLRRLRRKIVAERLT